MEFLKENIPLYISHHPEWIVQPNYKDLIFIEVTKFYICKNQIMNENIKDIYNENINQILIETSLYRSKPTEISKCLISEEHIQQLRNIPQPEQKTAQWYLFRHDHITASNAWKTFGTQSTKNQLIYEKCKPINPYVKSTPTFTETPMTWGHQYEPLSRMIYEEINQTKIEDFGCIPHQTYNFLAASPDGIVVGQTNFGRMIEIKNVVSREITGIPKMDYYIQCLIQMEVCNLPECDFLETKFIEYGSYHEFINDVNICENINVCNSINNNKKGVIMVFIENEEYVYKYLPFSIQNEFDINQWLDENTSHTWLKNVYWKLEIYSCVLIQRNQAWFQYALPHFQDIWNIICAERIGDYSLRAPKKRNNKIDIKKIDDNIVNECN